MASTNREEPTTVEVLGRSLHCYACGYDRFWAAQRTAEHVARQLIQLRLD